MTKIPLSDDELDSVSGGAFRGNDPFSRAMRQLEAQVEFAARAQLEAAKAGQPQQTNSTAKHVTAEQTEGAKQGTPDQAQNQPQAKSTGTGLAAGQTPTSVSDQLARVINEQFQQQRQSIVQDRLQVREDAKAELLKQVDTLKDSAQAHLANSIANAGAISVMGSAVGIKSAAMDDQMKTMKGANTGHDGLSKELSSVDTQAKSHAPQMDNLSKAAVPTANGSDEMSKQIAATKSSIEAANASMVKDVSSFIRELQDAKLQQMKSLTRD